MIPLDDNPQQRRRHFPIVTLLIIAANVTVFLYELSLGPTLDGFVRGYGVIPADISGASPFAPQAAVPLYLTLITSMFIHGGFLHIGGNMLFLWVFGDNVEDDMGPLPFLAFYLVCGIIAALLQIVVDPKSHIPSIGASGAIAGVLAAYLLLFPGANVRTLLLIGPFVTLTRVSALLMIGVWILFQIVSGLAELSLSTSSGSGVAFWAHVGGFGAGLAIVGLWRVLGGSRARPTGS